MITATARLPAQPTAPPLQLHKAQLWSPYFCYTKRRLRSAETQQEARGDLAKEKSPRAATGF